MPANSLHLPYSAVPVLASLLPALLEVAFVHRLAPMPVETGLSYELAGLPTRRAWDRSRGAQGTSDSGVPSADSPAWPVQGFVRKLFSVCFTQENAKFKLQGQTLCSSKQHLGGRCCGGMGPPTSDCLVRIPGSAFLTHVTEAKLLNLSAPHVPSL